MINWQKGESNFEIVSDCGKYRIVKNPSVYPCEYTPQYLHETMSGDGYMLQSWKRIEKPKQSADEAKEVVQKYKDNNK